MKNFTVFDVLKYLEFESGNVDFYELPKRIRELRNEFWETSKLLRIWKKLEKLSPNMRNIDRFLSKYFGGHFSIGRLTVFGCNAMMYIITWHSDNGYWRFRPPCFNTHWERWTWGCFYFSPNGTPGHPEAKIFYDDRY